MKKPVNMDFILYSKIVNEIDLKINPYLTSSIPYNGHYKLFRRIYKKVDHLLHDKIYFNLDIYLRREFK
jgi:hypothetical protein